MKINNFEFGPVKGINISHLGIALENANGNMVSYDRNAKEIIDVELLNFNAENMVYAIPCAVKDIKEGDVIRHVNGNTVFVISVEDGIHVVDVAAGEKKEIMPVKSMFGFDFVTKIVTLIDFSSFTASEDKPFGNILPFLLLNNEKNSMKDIFPMMMLMNGGLDKGAMNFDSSNMINLLMLTSFMENRGGSESNDFFPLMMLNVMMNSNQK